MTPDVSCLPIISSPTLDWFPRRIPVEGNDAWEPSPRRGMDTCVLCWSRPPGPFCGRHPKTTHCDCGRPRWQPDAASGSPLSPWQGAWSVCCGPCGAMAPYTIHRTLPNRDAGAIGVQFKVPNARSKPCKQHERKIQFSSLGIQLTPKLLYEGRDPQRDSNSSPARANPQPISLDQSLLAP